MNNKLQFIFLFLMFFLLNIGIKAQDFYTVKGTIVDKNTEEPLIGVTVLLKGTTIGTITSFDGKYTISIPVSEDRKTLLYSFIGYKSIEIDLTTQKVIDISLEEDIEKLDEVIVVGYGTQKKRDLTGAVTSLKGENVTKGNNNSLQEALAGRIAGVQVTQTDNGPGAGINVTIRGGSTLTGGNQPLYVIDGFPILPNDDPAFNPLNDFSPNQIESIEVLKDASSTAIYGSQGANGVIIITTKKGIEGKPKITAEFSYGISELAETPEILSPNEYADWQMKLLTDRQFLQPNGANGTEYFQSIYDGTYGYEGVVWLDEITRQANTINGNVSLTGGTNSTKYSVGVGYYEQEGIIIGSGFNRFNINTKLDQKVNHRLKIGATLQFSSSRTQGFNNSWDENSTIKKALQTNPYLPKDLDDKILQEIEEEAGVPINNSNAVDNVITYVNEVDKQLNTMRVMNNIFLDYKIANGLTFYTSYGINYNLKEQTEFYPSTVRQGSQVNGLGKIRDNKGTNSVYQARLMYNKTFNKAHKLNITGVFESRTSENINKLMQVQNFGNETNGIFDLSSAQTILPPSNFYTGFNTLSGLGRLNYGYKGKYLVTASLRADGSSKFSNNNKWGYFPSLGIGWVVSDENFMSDARAFDLVKLRASYGVTGNNQIPPYRSTTQYGQNNYVFSNSMHAGIVPVSIANENLRWETTSQYNVGLDLGFFEGKLQITAEAYYKYTTDLLLEVQLPPTTGFDKGLANIGSISNKGVELSINTVNIDRNGFKWTSALTFSRNIGKVIDLGESEEMYFSRNFFHKIKNDVVLREGDPIGMYYGYVQDGVYNSQYEIDNSPENKIISAEIGQIKYYDVNGDGKITEADKIPLASTLPDFIGGLANDIYYKNFDLSFFFRWSYGNDVVNGNITYLDRIGFGTMNTLRSFTSNTYSPSNPMGTMHGQGDDTYSAQMRSNYIEDGSFLKLDYITLGYTLPQNVYTKSGITRLRVFARVTNPWMWTRYTWFDPEVSTGYGTVAKIGPGADVGTYPRSRTYSLGLTIGL
ncbi:TonB-dependent receptor [Flammeovirga sp. MY04]|uniref:SusC/RagA family TonB-linked outer membrane protein n=1 Tax=Flammeovirga sp. MY04 TaxID=1191459 RepID=UPI0008060AD1|nr:TonB-dependent receptor [Flammeovirga sp. MY04]ANQ52562.1 TonB-dependent receptor [Flammeovirga sp. MY04]